MTRRHWYLTVPLLGLISPVAADAARPQPALHESADATTAESERYRPDKIVWSPCPDNPAVECGTLTLPVDYDDRHGETFDMAVARIKATDPARRIGVLFTNPGGPGVSGVNFITGAVANLPVFAPFRERFDIVSFDPRGVARSRGIHCSPVDIGVDLPDDLGDDAAVIAAFDTFSRTYADECLAKDGAFIGRVSTHNAARDMDVLRRALGERKVTYAAGSYGTQLGPGHVYDPRFAKRCHKQTSAVRRTEAGVQGQRRSCARPGLRAGSGKTPLPADAEDVFKTAVPDDPVNPKNWFGRNADGQTYRFSGSNDGTAHFSGIDGVGDGVRNLTAYAKARLDELGGGQR